jgi:hypothetical protein
VADDEAAGNEGQRDSDAPADSGTERFSTLTQAAPKKTGELQYMGRPSGMNDTTQPMIVTTRLEGVCDSRKGANMRRKPCTLDDC